MADEGHLRFQIEADNSQVTGKAAELSKALNQVLEDAKRVERVINKLFDSGNVGLKGELARIREFNRAMQEIGRGSPETRFAAANQRAAAQFEKVAQNYRKAFDEILGVNRGIAQRADKTYFADLLRREEVDFKRLQEQRRAQALDSRKRFQETIQEFFTPRKPATQAKDTLFAGLLRREEADYRTLQEQRRVQGIDAQKRFNEFVQERFFPSKKPALAAKDTLFAEILRREEADIKSLESARAKARARLSRSLQSFVDHSLGIGASFKGSAASTMLAQELRNEESAARALIDQRNRLGRDTRRSLQSFIDNSLGIGAPIRKSAASTMLADRLREEQKKFGGSDITHRVIDRVKANGGGDFLELQSRLMVNFQMIAAAYRSFTFLTGFVRDLDREFRQFQAITASSSAEMAKLEEKLIGVSEKFRFTAVEVAQAATVMAQAGFSTREIEDSMEAVALLATATGTDLKTTVDTITSVLGVFDLQASETKNVANTLTAAINETKLTMDKLALGIQYASNIAKQAGVTYVELTAILGGLANAGIRSGSTLGTGVRQLLIELQSPNRKFRDRLGRLGLNDNDINIQTQTFIGVLQNLKDAGFTAADAMQVFEVRSAAAFAAISNNIDTVHRLERSLLLSSAAVKANETQMESLANTWAKFQSVVGTVAFRAFRPLLETLQETTDAFADSLAVLNQYPAAAAAVGTALAGIATGIVLTKLLKLSGYLLGLRGEALTAVGAFNALKSATMSLSGAMALLARTGPFLLLSTAASALIYLVGTTSRELAGLEDRIDKTNSRVRDFEGSVETIENTLTAVDEAIASLAKQSTRLEQDQALLSNRILEAKLRFGEYGFQIDKTAESVDGLMAAYQRLRREQQSLQTLELENLQTEKQKLLELHRQALVVSANGQGLGDRFGQAFGLRNPVISGTDEFGDQIAPISKEAMQSRLRDLYGQGVADAFRIPGLGHKAQDLDPQDLTNAIGAVKEALRLEERRLAEATTRETRAPIAGRIEALEALLDRVEEVSRNFTQFLATQTGLENTDQELITSHLKGKDQFARADALSDQLEREIYAGLADIFKQDLGTEERLRAIKDFRAALEQDFQSLDFLIHSLGKDEGLISQYGPERVHEAIRALGFGSGRAVLENLILGRIENLNEHMKGILEDENRAQQQATQKDIQTVLTRIRNTSDPEQVAILEQQAVGLFEELRQLRIFAVEKFGDADGAALERQRIQSLRTTKAEEERFQEQVRERLERIAENEADTERKVAEEVNRQNIAALKEELRVIVQKIRTAKDPTELARLRQEGLATLQQIQDLELQAIDNFSDATDEMLELQKKGKLRESAGERAQFEEVVGQTFERIYQAGAELQIEVLKDQRDRLLGLLGDLKARLTRAKTPEQVAALEAEFAQIASLVQALDARIIHRENASILTGPGGLKPSAKANAIQREIILAAQARGVDPRTALAISSLETGGTFSPTARNPGSSAFGLFQFLDATWKRFGLSRTEDPNVQITVGIELLARNMQALEKTLGRQASLEEQYLAHLMGLGGAKALLTADPDSSALQALTGIHKDPAATLTKNGLSVDATVGQVLDRFNDLIGEHAENVVDLLEGGLNEELYTSRVEAQTEESVEALNEALSRFTERSIDLRLKAIDEAYARADQAINLNLDALGNRYNRDRISEIQAQAMKEVAEIEHETIVLTRLNQLKELQAELQVRINAARAAGSATAGQLATLEEKLALVTHEVNAAQADYLALTQKIAEIPLKDLIAAALSQWGRQAGVFKSMNVMIAEGIRSVVETAHQGFLTMFEDIRTGSKSAGEAFRDFGLMVLDTIAKIMVQQAANKIFGMILNFGLSMLGAGMSGGGGSSAPPGTGITFTGTGAVGPSGPVVYHGGGSIGTPTGRTRSVPMGVFANAPRLHTGGYLAPNERPIIAEEGEFMLRRSTVDLIGRRRLEELNALGNRRMSESPIRPLEGETQAQPGVMNVWVVSQDQVPPPGPNDIIAAVVDNGRRGGPIKQLIKSVQMGAI